MRSFPWSLATWQAHRGHLREFCSTTWAWHTRLRSLRLWLRSSGTGAASPALGPAATGEQHCGDATSSVRIGLTSLSNSPVVPSHNSCTPPPPAEQVDAYCLVGQPGHKNGEKLLRTALISCEEWRDSTAREAAAKAAEQEGLPDLAATLLAKDSSRLRKAQFIWLCRHWGYASRWWQRKHNGAGRGEDSQPRRRRRVDAGAVDGETLHIVTPPSRLLLSGRDEALVALAGAVRPALLSVSSWRAVAAEAHFRSLRGAGIDWSRVRNMQGALEMNRFMRDAVELKREALQQYRADLDESALGEAAYALETRSFTPESELDALRTIMEGGLTVTTSAAARIRQQLGELPRCEEAYADSFRQGHAAVMLLIHVLHSSVARRRFDSSLVALLDEAEACLEVLFEYTSVAECALQARIVWLTELCTLQGDAAGQRDILLAKPAALPSLFNLWPAGRARNAPLLTSRQLSVF